MEGNIMDRYEWFELLDKAQLSRNALGYQNMNVIVEEVLELIDMIERKAEESAEYEGWIEELENYPDGLN